MSQDRAERVLKRYLSALAVHANIDVLIDKHVEYISLKQNPGELVEIMPWVGSHSGLAEFKRMCEWMKESCNYLSFDTDIVFGNEKNAAAIGRFSYCAKSTERPVSAPPTRWS